MRKGKRLGGTGRGCETRERMGDKGRDCETRGEAVRQGEGLGDKGETGRQGGDWETRVEAGRQGEGLGDKGETVRHVERLGETVPLFARGDARAVVALAVCVLCSAVGRPVTGLVMPGSNDRCWESNGVLLQGSAASYRRSESYTGAWEL